MEKFSIHFKRTSRMPIMKQTTICAGSGGREWEIFATMHINKQERQNLNRY